MITKQQVLDIITERVEQEGYFLVDIDIKPINKIVVLVDGDEGVPIEFCVSLSRLIESSIDREIEDYELEVSSPGIGQPLKVYRQYLKCVGSEVEVLALDGMKYKGTLNSVSDSGVVITEEKKVKIKGRKKKELQIVEHNFSFENIKSVKETIKF